MELEGVLHFHSETGSEGGYWVFQDKRFIIPNTTRFSCVKCHKYWDKGKNPGGVHDCIPPQCLPDEHDFQPICKEDWSYEGLQVLEDGDSLTIYSKEDPTKVVWSGTVHLLNYPIFTLSIFGMWVHSEPTHILSPTQLKLKKQLITDLSATCTKLWKARYKNKKVKTKKESKSLKHRIEFLSSERSRLIKKLCGPGLRKRKEWGKWFFEGYPAKLIKAQTS